MKRNQCTATYFLYSLVITACFSLAPRLAHSQLYRRPVPDTASMTLDLIGDNFKYAFHPDGIHIILYTPLYKVGGGIGLNACRFNWRTGMPDSCIRVQDIPKDFFASWESDFSLPQLPEEFVGVMNEHYDYPDGSKTFWTYEGREHFSGAKLITWKLKKGKRDYALRETELATMDMLRGRKIPVCPTSPVYALISTRKTVVNPSLPDAANIFIYDANTDTVISRLYNSDVFGNYARQSRQWVADSTARAARSAEVKKEMQVLIDGIRGEGWTIEKIKYGLGFTPSSTNNDGLVWDFNSQPGRMYATVALLNNLPNASLSEHPLVHRLADMDLSLVDDFYSWAHFADLGGSNLRYMLSNAFYTSIPGDPVRFGIGLTCNDYTNDCLYKEMADSNNLCRILISRVKTAENELPVRALNQKIKVLDLNQVYTATVQKQKQNIASWAAEEKRRKQQEKADSVKAKNALQTDENFRKQWIATVKKGLKPGQTVAHEILLKEVPSGSILSVYMNQPRGYRRSLYVLSNDTANFVDMEYASADVDNYQPLPNNKELNLGNNYSVTYTYWIGPVSEFKVSARTDKPLRLSAVLVVQKDEALYAYYKTKLNEINERKEERRNQRDQEYNKENALNDSRAKKVQAAYESFGETIRKLNQDMRENGETFTLNQQIDLYNTAATALKELQQALNTNVPDGFFAGNQANESYKKYFQASMDYYSEIKAQIKKIKDSIDDKKSSGKPVIDAYISSPLITVNEWVNEFLRKDLPH